MGVFSDCNNPYSVSSSLYIMMIIIFLTVGILYETGTIPRKTEYEKESVWLYGFFGLIAIMILGLLTHVFAYLFRTVGSNRNNSFKKFVTSHDLPRYYWTLSHVLAYMMLAIVSPGQWPLWLSIGLLWEWLECYTFCFSKRGIPIGCSGMYDVLANIAGIGIGLWIHSQFTLDSLYCKNTEIKGIC